MRGKGGEGLDKGGAGGGVEEEKIDESIDIWGGGVRVVNVLQKGGEYGVAGDGGMGVDDVDEMVDQVRKALCIELHAMNSNVASRWRVAILTVALELTSAMAGDCSGDASSDVAAEDVVAAERAEGGDLAHVGGVGAVVELLALSRCRLGGEEAAVSGRDEATADRVKVEREKG